MLIRVTSSYGPVYYQSSLLNQIGVPHAFSTRIGGVSSGIFASLNLGNPNGCPQQDSLENIAKNYDLLQKAIGCPNRFRAQVHQIHGCDVQQDRIDQPFDIHAKADAIISSDPSKIVSVRTADCVPVLLSNKNGTQVAAIHAGWRGVAAGIVTETLRSFEDHSSVVAAIGPAIGYEAFEVGPEVVAAILQKHGPNVPHRFCDDGKARIDLQSALIIELCHAGIAKDQIDTSNSCTFSDQEGFFSHRRDRGITGRMASMIGVCNG